MTSTLGPPSNAKRTRLSVDVATIGVTVARRPKRRLKMASVFSKRSPVRHYGWHGNSVNLISLVVETSRPPQPMKESACLYSYRFGRFELQPSERRLLAAGVPAVL